MNDNLRDKVDRKTKSAEKALLMIEGKVISLSSYPVKGLSAKKLETVEIKAGQGFPNDRMFALAKANGRFDPANPKPVPKDNFIVLLQHAKLAGLGTSYDVNEDLLTVKQESGRTDAFRTDQVDDCQRLTDFLIELLGLPDEEAPVFASAFPHRFTDVSVVSEKMMNAISLVNLASVNAFGEAISKEIDPRRFRANIVIDGLPPFMELDLVDNLIKISGVSFRVLQRTRRCAATEVNPDTTERDIHLPYLLRKTYGHMDMGIYIEALEDGEIFNGSGVIPASA